MLSVGLLAGCAAPTPPPPAPPQVRLVRPRPIDRIDSATYQSTLEAIRELRLAPEIAGRIVAMPVYEGQEVKAGQLLFRLDQIQLQAEVNADAAKDPSLVNSDPFGKGWLVKIRASDASPLAKLMDAATYDSAHPVH